MCYNCSNVLLNWLITPGRWEADRGFFSVGNQSHSRVTTFVIIFTNFIMNSSFYEFWSSSSPSCLVQRCCPSSSVHGHSSDLSRGPQTFLQYIDMYALFQKHLHLSAHSFPSYICLNYCIWKIPCHSVWLDGFAHHCRSSLLSPMFEWPWPSECIYLLFFLLSYEGKASIWNSWWSLGRTFVCWFWNQELKHLYHLTREGISWLVH